MKKNGCDCAKMLRAGIVALTTKANILNDMRNTADGVVLLGECAVVLTGVRIRGEGMRSLTYGMHNSAGEMRSCADGMGGSAACMQTQKC